MATLARWAPVPFTSEAAERAAPAPPRRVTGPLLMGDILASQAGTPVFLREWRAAEEAHAGRPGARDQSGE
ncbi:hypothetical protein [Rhodosalinus sp. FB01]|uniref:hypothetical protein n=1 Tax=Rhodosalinus sp. FB01 TaxID=3239194 RepID=UPI0035248888